MESEYLNANHEVFPRRFSEALRHIWVMEGEFSDHPEDLGGPTKYGITEQTYQDWLDNVYPSGKPPEEAPRQVKDINYCIAAEIYFSQYWFKTRCDELYAGLDLMVFDSAVHAGPRRAIRWLQKALNKTASTTYPPLPPIAVDGWFGPKTLARLHTEAGMREAVAVIREMALLRLFLAYEQRSDTFIRGWFSRILKTFEESLLAFRREYRYDG